MKQRVWAPLALAAALSGCVTGTTIVKKDAMSLPLLIGTAGVTLVVSSILASQVAGYSLAGSAAAGLAMTAADVGVGCLFGACAPFGL